MTRQRLSDHVAVAVAVKVHDHVNDHVNVYVYVYVDVGMTRMTTDLDVGVFDRAATDSSAMSGLASGK
jgi:hypothetical protein